MILFYCKTDYLLQIREQQV